MTAEPAPKRSPGQTTVNLTLQPSGEPVYLVLSESVRMPDGWRHRCGSDVLSATVAHPVHDGLFLLSGSGRVHQEQVPYCPTCETVPNYHGSYITPH